MQKFKLICDNSCDLDTHVVTHEFNAASLDDVVMNLDMFLRGVGYSYDGELGVVDYQPVQIEVTQHNQYFYDKDRNK